ncbi:right-handed parallel beta-helix repeat-containing protein, partial [uncultured Methanobrevibacter sp.]|uniref:right-handed parallel beta-helix repeat-containing protein n=1 Tax=uncultured Methanobrevibacter sp. TaxID=253161 RepID=UPI0025F4E451
MNTTSTHKDKLGIVKEKSNNLLSDGENSSLADLANDISNADSTLDLSKDYIYNSSKDINISDNGIVISKSLVINGNGHTIDAKGAKRIFEINASNIILKNIIFTNGRHNSGGGAIFIASDFTNITFENCDFHDNSAFIMGGAIYAGSTIKIINCNFTNNQLNGSGSSSDARRGGAVYIDKNDSLILYSQFNSNNAQYGGALFIHGSNLTLSYCNFTSNVASIWGGAINDKSDVFSNYILKCRFISNSALQGGSAFNLNAQNSHIDGCYFENNIVTRSDYSDGCGGVVRSVASGTLINSSTFVNNKNTLNGAVFLQANSSYNFVDNCTFTNNEAFYGGAVGIFGKNSKLSNSRINAQSMTGSDKYGAVYVSGTNNEIVNCTFTNCVNNNNDGAALYWKGDSGILSNSTFSNNGARYGGAVLIYGSKVSVYNCTFLKNTANNHGGALYVANNNINITNCYFADNKASLNDGGAIYFLINTKNSIVDNCKFINNYAKWIGSAIACFGSNMTFKNSYFKGNNNTFAAGEERYGGVIGFRDNGNSKIINCTIEGSRNYYGGAIKIFSTSPNIEIYNSTFHSNTAFDGGAIECDASGLKVVGCDFDGNYALDNGGSIIVRASNSAFIKCNFSNSYVRDHDGGAIELIPGHNNLIIDECRFIDNYAQWIGSAIGCFGGNVQINNSYFKGNKNAFRQDSSTNHWYGGALSFRTSSNNKIFNCTFEENQNYAGGAIRVFSGGNIQILNSSFINNVARSYGGAFYSDIGIIIINCSFINNTAQEYYGGAVYSYGGSTNIANSLFVGNTAKSGSAFFGDSTGHVIRDSIFLNNTVTATGFIISSSNGNNRVDANYNWFGNVVGDKSVKPNVYSGIKLTRWYFLDIDVNEQFLYTNGASNITFSLNRYYNSEEDVVIKGDFKYPDIVKLNITSRDDMLGFRNITLDNNKEYPTQTVYIPEIGVYNITATYMGVTARNSVYYVPPDSFTALNRTIGLNYNNNLVLNHSYRYYDEYDFLFLKTGIIIKKPISIDGNGTTIDGKNKVRIFYVESDNVNLTNLNFVNGYADNGGAVYWKGDYGSLNLCNFTNNQANALSFSGGALYWEGNYGLINNTNFKNNSANKYSSSDAGDGGALAIKGMHVAVDYCNFTENNCANCGAAIVSGPTQYINITNSIFSNNKAKTVSSSSVAGVAGAIYMESSDFIIYNCTFKNNFASYWGGAIRASAKGSIISSIFLNNTSPAGSAVYANAGGVNISDCIILSNKGGYAVDSDASNRITANNNWWGNTLNNQKTKPSIHSRVSISNWYFLDIDTSGKYFLIGETCNVTYRLDQITTSGGVVTQRKLNNIFPIEFNFTATIGDLDKYYAILDEDKIINGSFVSDEVGICTISVTALGVTASTKVYYVPPDSFMALNMTIERNYGTNLNLTHGYQYYQDYDFELLNTGVIINKHINITGNGHTLNAKNKLRVFQLSADNVHIDGINYINGYSTDNGGLIHVTGKNLVLSNSNFTGGSANRYSGAVHIDAKNTTIINSTFTNNKIRVTGKNYYGGGALAVSSVSEGSSLIGCKFFNNYAYMSGGAILWDGPNGTIKDTYFEGNNAKTFDGGAIQLRGNAVNMVIDNVTAYKNRDGGYGSAISSFAANTLINNSRFVGNDYNNARSFGGTVHLAGSNSVFVNSYFENNRAYNGGAITTLSSNSIIKNITFINNRAVKFGGAIHVQDSPSNVDVSNCTFIGNYAGHTGGALRVTSTNALGFRLTNSIFKNNHAYNYGGAVSIQSPNAIINNTYYDNNYVNKHDGGALDVGSNNVIVDNSTFNNNRAIFGGGVVWYKANGKLINSVFTNNFATVHDGGGLCAFSGATNLYVYNVTMNNNRAKYMGSAIHSDATGTTIVNSSFDHNTNTGNDYGGTLAFYKTNVHIIGCNLTNNNNYYGGA